MLENIIDYRTNPYKITVNAVVEPSWHDNSAKNSDQFEVDRKNDFLVDETRISPFEG